MTRLQLKQAVTWEGKLDGNTAVIAQLDSIISDAIVFVGQSHVELLLIEPIQYDLASENPTPIEQALAVDRVELFGAEGVTEDCTIPEEGNVVGPAPLPGWPKCYSVEGNAASGSGVPKGLSVRLSGGGSLDIGVDFFTVFWKKIPTITDDTHVVPDAWVPFLKREILARLGLNRSKDEGENAKGYTVGATNALQTQTNNTNQSTTQTN